MQTELNPTLLKPSQVEEAANLLARVFQHAPDMIYFLGDKDRMLARATLHFYQSVIRAGLLYGEVYTTPSLDGLAVWVSPDHNDFSLDILVRTGMLKALLSTGLGPLIRFVRSSSYVERLQKEAITEPRWILVQIGVDPSRQGKGIGGLLMQPILQRADKDGVPCYVESADERNLNFYLRHGFEIVKRGHVPNNGPKVWIMIRRPVEA